MVELYKTTKGGKIHPTLKWINITPQDGNYAFGYYDRCPFSSDNKHHLAFKFDQQERLPKPGETATVGFIEIASKKFTPVAETEAWCHQQGSMTQWLPGEPGNFIFNDFRKEDDGTLRLISRVHDIHGEFVREYDYPLYRLSPDGQVAATLNFSRIPRRGYTYASAPWPEEVPVPDLENNGLFLMDMKTGERRLVIPYKKILEKHPVPEDFELDGETGVYDMFYHWMNHTCFNIDGSRVMVLHRFQQIFGWRTFMWTCNLDGSDLICSLPYKYWLDWGISHQLWGRTPREIIVDGDKNSERPDGKHMQYLVFDEDKGADTATSISDGFGFKGHLNFSPDGQWLVGDSYPIDDFQYLNLTRVEDGKIAHLGTFFHGHEQMGDWRCDLHPRWSADGKFLSVDTIHYGNRKILILDMENAIKTLFE